MTTSAASNLKLFIGHIDCLTCQQGTTVWILRAPSRSLVYSLTEAKTHSLGVDGLARNIRPIQARLAIFAFFPSAQTEQHGPHLPVNTDSLLATATCMYASAKTAVPMLPTIPYGCSLGHTDHWPGTLSPHTGKHLGLTIRRFAQFLMLTGFRRF